MTMDYQIGERVAITSADGETVREGIVISATPGKSYIVELPALVSGDRRYYVLPSHALRRIDGQEDV